MTPIRGHHHRAHVVPITAPSFPTLPRPQIFRKIAYTFVALAVIVLVGVLWLSSVRADVTVTVKKTPIKLDGSVELAKTPQTGQIPGRVIEGVYEKIQQFDVNALLAEAASSTASSTRVSAPGPALAPAAAVTDESVRAKGTVRIINKYSRSQTLVKTTRLLTADKKLYRIDRTIVVPSGGEVSVSAYADQLGSSYVIGPTKFTIPGLYVDLQKYIYAVSDAAFTGAPEKAPANAPAPPPAVVQKPAASKTGAIVTGTVLDLAQKRLTDAVLDQAKKALAAEMADPKLGEVVYQVKLLEKKNSVTVGQTADTFLASIKLDVTAAYYSKEDMLSLIRSKLTEKVPEGRDFIPFDENAVAYSLEAADIKAETATIHVIASAGYRLNAAGPGLQKNTIAGKSKDEAVTILKAVDGVENVDIKITPSWLGRIPSLKDHINITIQ